MISKKQECKSIATPKTINECIILCLEFFSALLMYKRYITLKIVTRGLGSLPFKCC